ncbi:MAG: AAA family ATPase [Patescibacteria group bacterium]|nr:AAA family ATPase [Patescibacteria group bacterium]
MEKKVQQNKTNNNIIKGVAMNLDFVREEVKKNFIGHDDVIERILPYIKIGSLQIVSKRPIANIFLAGPPATGKTYLPEVLSRVVHQTDWNEKPLLIRINCNEFTLEHEVAKLIGAPPGYIGHRETTPFLNPYDIQNAASHRSPIRFVLFDEIEKAHPTFYKLIINLMENGEIRLADGNKVNFTKCMIFFTSNLGTSQIMEEINGGLGLSRYAGLKNRFNDKRFKNFLKKNFPPEFVSRLDEIIVFNPLSKDEKRTVVELELKKLVQRIQIAYPYQIKWDKKLVDHVLSLCEQEDTDLRYLRNIVNKDILYKIVSIQDFEDIYIRKVINLSYNGKEIIVTTRKVATVKD